MRCARVGIALCGMIAATSSRATVIAPLAVADLTRLADRVVVGRVGASSSRFDDDGRRIVTDTELWVRETLKGVPLTRLLVRSSGGVVGELGQRVAGSARLLPGAQVLVFLQDEPARSGAEPLCRVVGLSRGLFTLVRAADGRELATQDLAGLQVLDPATGQLRAVEPEELDAIQLRQRVLELSAPPAAAP